MLPYQDNEVVQQSEVREHLGEGFPSCICGKVLG